MGRSQRPKEVKILLIGERSVGKTSLILSLVSEEFADVVPHRAEEITIPADVTPERVPTRIIDYSVYSLEDTSTFEKISVKWLPLIEECLDQKTPIILVGNKADLVEDTNFDDVLCLMNRYVQIETCVECSAKILRNVSEMFYYAQKAVLHPTRPLYLPEKKVLTEKCEQALERVFKRGRHETVWTVLRKFGYDDNLQFVKEYLYPHLKVPHGCTTELSSNGEAFLISLFDKYDRDGDGTLNFHEIEDLFSTCPVVPWDQDSLHSVETNEKGWITLQGYLSQWMLTTFLDVSCTLKYLAYLGYPINENENQLTAVVVTREKHLDINQKRTSRRVFQCHLIGPKNSGKKTLCQGLLGHSWETIQKIPVKELSQQTINRISVYGQEKYLVLKSVEVIDIEDLLLPQEVQCDVVCLVYNVDNPKSFEYIARLYLKYFADSKIPTLIVASKNDLPQISQDYLMQPEAFCIKHNLPPPQYYSSHNPSNALYLKLATMAAYPQLQQLGFIHHNASWFKTGLKLATITLIGVLLIRTVIKQRL